MLKSRATGRVTAPYRMKAVVRPKLIRCSMKKLVLASVAFISLAGFSVASGGYAVADDSSAPGHHQSMEVRAALLDAHLDGLKVGLKLTADQEKNWTGFENAVRAVAKDRAERFRQWREHGGWQGNGDGEPSLIDRLHRMSERLAQRSADLKTVADAAAPLYASLDDGQKRVFSVLFREFARHGRHGGHGRDEAR